MNVNARMLVILKDSPHDSDLRAGDLVPVGGCASRNCFQVAGADGRHWWLTCEGEGHEWRRATFQEITRAAAIEASREETRSAVIAAMRARHGVADVWEAS